VEADVSGGQEGTVKLVGLAEKSVQESVSRIQAALRNSPDAHRDWAGPKVTINLAPADVKKDSAAFDLPIAAAVMLASGQFFSEKLDDYLLLGELALDGRVRGGRGALAGAMLAAQQERRRVIVPADNAAEAAVVEALDVTGAGLLSDAVGVLTDELPVLSWTDGPVEPHVVDVDEVFAVASQYDVDFSDVRGQESAKRALTVASACCEPVEQRGITTRLRRNRPAGQRQDRVREPLSVPTTLPAGRALCWRAAYVRGSRRGWRWAHRPPSRRLGCEVEADFVEESRYNENVRRVRGSAGAEANERDRKGQDPSGMAGRVRGGGSQAVGHADEVCLHPHVQAGDGRCAVQGV